MKRVIEGKSYNTDTAEHICDLECSDYPNDFRYHDTALYRTKKGAYFLSGEGGPMSMWSRAAMGGGSTSGKGIQLIDYAEARETAERAGLDEEEMTAAGFKIEEG